MRRPRHPPRRHDDPRRRGRHRPRRPRHHRVEQPAAAGPLRRIRRRARAPQGGRGCRTPQASEPGCLAHELRRRLLGRVPRQSAPPAGPSPRRHGQLPHEVSPQRLVPQAWHAVDLRRRRRRRGRGHGRHPGLRVPALPVARTAPAGRRRKLRDERHSGASDRVRDRISGGGGPQALGWRPDDTRRLHV